MHVNLLPPKNQKKFGLLKSVFKVFLVVFVFMNFYIVTGGYFSKEINEPVYSFNNLIKQEKNNLTALPAHAEKDIIPRRINPNNLGLQLTADSALVVDAASETILYSKNFQQIRPIASITKLVSAAVFLNSVNGNDLNRPIVISQQDETHSHAINLYRDEKVLLSDVFKTALIASDNNAVMALVRASGLGQPEFVDQMNQLAADWGLQKTVFVEPTGLSPANQSTAEEIVIICQKVLSYPLIQQVLLKAGYEFQSISGIEHHIYSTNKLLESFINRPPYEIVIGKTGYISQAGYCLVIKVKNQANNQQVTAVVLGADSNVDRFAEIKALVDWVFENYSWQSL